MPTSKDGVDWTDEITTVYRFDPTRNGAIEGKEDLNGIFERARKTVNHLPSEFVYNLYVQVCAELVRSSRSRNLAEGTLIHGQLRPERIFVSPDGAVHVEPPSPEPAPSGEDRSGAARRSYLPPEQLRGEKVDVRADIFALGLCMGELFTLRRLADPRRTASGEVEKELLAGLRGGTRAAQELGRVLATSLAKDVGRRHRTLNVLIGELRQAGKKLGFRVGPSVTAAYLRQLFASNTASREMEAPALRQDGNDDLDVFAMLAKAPPNPGLSSQLPPPASATGRTTSVPPPPGSVPPPPLSSTGPISIPPPAPISFSPPPPPASVRPFLPPAHGGPDLPPPPPPPPPPLPVAFYESEPPPGLGHTIPPGSRPWIKSRAMIMAGVSRYRSLPRAWQVGIGLGLAIMVVAPFTTSSKGTLFVAATGQAGQRLANVATTVDGAKECIGDRCAFDLSPGMHEVSIRAEGYSPQLQVVVIRSKEETAVNFRLEKAVSALRVKGQPDGVLMLVDGERVGRLPQQVELPPGQHRLRFEAPGYAPEERSVELAIGEARALADVVLRPAIGHARFDLRVPGTDISLYSDNERRDHVDVSRPVDLDLSRTWTLEARKPGYPLVRQPLEWGGATEQTFVVSFDKAGMTGPGRAATADVARAVLPTRSRGAGAGAAPAAAPQPAAVAPAAAPAAANDSAPAAARAGGASEDCSMSFNSIPMSNVFLDNVRLGMTPQVHVMVRPGAHTVQFLLGDVKKAKSFTCEGGFSKIIALHLNE